jgi:hypothetical protein
MNTEASHLILGRLLLTPDSWCWTGSFSHDGVAVDLRLNTFRPDQVPALHVTTICPEYGEAFERVKPMIGARMRSVADWVCSDLTAWFNASDLGRDDVLQRLKLSCVVLWPDGTTKLLIDEPHLYETGHSIEADIGLDGTISYLNLAG